jgi:MCP family monocarboxylic acid transporter-like MFS transporter 3
VTGKFIWQQPRPCALRALDSLLTHPPRAQSCINDEIPSIPSNKLSLIMSTTTITTQEHVELSTFSPASLTRLSPVRSPQSVTHPISSTLGSDEVPADAPYSVSAIPDGGYGWVIVGAAFLTTFCHNGIINCWGVLQAALLDSTLSHIPPSTLAYVGSLALGGGALYGLAAVRMMCWFGSHTTILVGVFLMGMSLIGASFSTTNLAGLFGTAGLLGGVGMAMVYTVTNALPVQYFSARLGLANGIIKLGGGVGGCVMAIALEAMYQRVGIAWTFRFQGLMILVLGMPAAWMLKDRVPLRNVPFVDWSMFRSVPFLATFVASAIGVFALYVPPYYLPLFAKSIGLSSGTGAGLVAAFNACKCRNCSSPTGIQLTWYLQAMQLVASQLDRYATRSDL